MPSMRAAFSSSNARRALGSFGLWSKTTTPVAPVILLSDIPIDEELAPGYDPRYLYPVNTGAVPFNNHELTAKLGFGTSSIVWLARDAKQYTRSLSNKNIRTIFFADFGDVLTAT